MTLITDCKSFPVVCRFFKFVYHRHSIIPYRYSARALIAGRINSGITPASIILFPGDMKRDPAPPTTRNRFTFAFLTPSSIAL